MGTSSCIHRVADRRIVSCAYTINQIRVGENQKLTCIACWDVNFLNFRGINLCAEFVWIHTLLMGTSDNSWTLIDLLRARFAACLWWRTYNWFTKMLSSKSLRNIHGCFCNFIRAGGTGFSRRGILTILGLTLKYDPRRVTLMSWMLQSKLGRRASTRWLCWTIYICIDYVVVLRRLHLGVAMATR